MEGKSEKVRQLLLEAASDLFARFGYDKTTVDDICRRAHKAKTSVYYYFDSKMSVFKAVLEEEMRHLREELSPYVDGTSPAPRLMTEYLKERMKIMTSLQVYREHAARLASPQGGEVAEAMRQVRGSFDRWEYEYFTRLCRDGKECGVISDAVKPDIFADMLIMLLKGVENQFFITTDLPQTRATYEYMVELLVGSVKPRENMNV